MTLPLSRAQLLELVRYYQTGVVNTLFGLGCYALLIWLGANIYAAQLIAHLMGLVFNYVTYSRHVFRGSAPAKFRFVLSYAANYLISLATMALVARLFASPYVIGVVTILIVSFINYFALKFLVFRRQPA